MGRMLLLKFSSLLIVLLSVVHGLFKLKVNLKVISLILSLSKFDITKSILGLQIVPFHTYYTYFGIKLCKTNSFPEYTHFI